MKILAIETSCDDTGIAILDVKGVKKSPDFDVLANVIASQIEIGKKYGGVYPMMAKREHQRNLLPVLIKALRAAGMLKIHPVIRPGVGSNDPTKLKEILEREPELLKKLTPFLKKYAKPDIDLISVTNGPGLEPCLWAGVNFAKALSYFWDIPVVPVNHIESHILVNFLPKINEISNFQFPISKQFKNSNFKNLFPAVCLVVSGGHTQIVLMEKPFGSAQGRLGNYTILGETRDDAAGECFDKCAKILGLGYPGGPIIAKLATKFQISNFKFKISLPRPMISTKDYDFSFSGLKTAVLYSWQKQYKKDLPRNERQRMVREMAAEVQQAIIDVLIKKTTKAVKDFGAKSLILGGGVSANQELRKQFLKSIRSLVHDVELIVPVPDLSTDNGLMTAVAGFYHKKETMPWQKIQADGNLRIGE